MTEPPDLVLELQRKIETTILETQVLLLEIIEAVRRYGAFTAALEARVERLEKDRIEQAFPDQ